MNSLDYIAQSEALENENFPENCFLSYKRSKDVKVRVINGFCV